MSISLRFAELRVKWPWVRRKELLETRALLDEALDGIKTAPHVCTVPGCPGDRNRRKLEAADRMAEYLGKIAVQPVEPVDGPVVMITKELWAAIAQRAADLAREWRAT